MLSTFYRNRLNPLFPVLFAAISGGNMCGQVNAFFNSAVFNTPSNQPYLETYLTISGKSLASKDIGGRLQNSLNVKLTVMDTSSKKQESYNVIGPAFASASVAPAFIDTQRYPIGNGTYTLQMVLADNYDTLRKPLTIKHVVEVPFAHNHISFSSLLPLENYTRSAAPGPLTRNGYRMVPYNVNYYPESTGILAFYIEAYHASLELGEGKPLLFTYYLEMDNNGKKLSNYGAFKKQAAAPVNVLLAKMDISKLGTGNYNLVVELRDQNNGLQAQSRYFFQRLNRAVDIVSLQEYAGRKTVAEYFGAINNTDTLKMLVECLWPIADNVDKERIINQAIGKDPVLMKHFVIDFWQRRAADTANPLKMWATYYQSVQKVMALFRCGKQKGYYTERGRVYLQYGPPNNRTQQTNEQNTFPYEIWQYYRLTDATNGQFFSNRKFVFVNKNLGDDCYNLVHSDMRGEINNPRWQFEVTRRNNNGMANPDNNTPAGTENNQFNEIYSNPR
jgi:GWxTD domain-containing protein